MTDNEIGLVVVNYNTRAHLVKFVQTLYEYTDHQAFQLYIIDNGSDDNMKLKRSLYPRKNMHIEVLGENIGLTKAWNHGITTLSPRDIIIAGSDVYFFNRSWLTELMKSVNDHPEWGMIHCNCITPNKSPTKTKRYYPDNRSSVQEIVRMRHDCVYIRRKLFDTIGLYNESFFLFGSDVDLQRRAVTGGWKLGYCGRSKVVHVGSISSRKAPKEIKEADNEAFFEIYGAYK